MMLSPETLLLQQEQQIKLRFIAHYCILLMLTGRITESELRVQQYNSILAFYVKNLRRLTDSDNRVST